MSCLKITKEIRELSHQLVGETEESTKNLVSLWQESNNKSIEIYPTAKELDTYRRTIRQADKNLQRQSSQSLALKTGEISAKDSTSTDELQFSTIEEQRQVDLEFDPTTRRDRVSLIARFFSNEVDSIIEEITEALTNRIKSSNDAIEKETLQNELSGLTRFTAIKKLTPKGIFDRIEAFFANYVNDTEENRIQAELSTLKSQKGSDKYTEEQLRQSAIKKAQYKLGEYQKVLNNYKVLAEEASAMLIMTEGIKIDPNYIAPAEANLNSDDPEGTSEGDDNASDWKQEEAYKDGWMTNVREVSSHDSLSQAVRKVIRQIPKLDYRGKYDKDDLGFPRYLDADYVHATLIDKLKDMIVADDMMPLLNNLGKQKPWVRQVVKLLNNDDVLLSQFYQDFRKDFVNYWIQKKKLMPDGSFKIETIAVNRPEGVYYLLDSWRDNYENGVLLDDDSVYTKERELSKENAAKGLTIVENLNNKFNNLSTEDRLKLLDAEDVWGDIMKALHMLGIDANPAILKNALTDIKTASGITFTDPIMLLLPQLNIIFNGIKKGEVKDTTNEETGEVKKGDLINTFGSAYNSIALMMAEVTEDAIESSIRENDKSYYSHVTPNYLGKLIKNLKNVMQDEERFNKFIEEEFKQYEWFYKDGKWNVDWINQLVNEPKLRDALQHKVLLNHDKTAYQDWDDLDYTVVLLNEYWAEPRESMAWYHVPILSDSPSAEFIRFKRYTNGSEIDPITGEKLSYQDIILNHMVNLVNQEYDRIMLVRERDAMFINGDTSISPIANYDISRDEEGNIKSLGGAEFKFLPALNNYSVNGKSFIDIIVELKQGSGADLREVIKTAVRSVIEDEFESTYKDWDRIGLFDELPNGRYKNLPFVGQSEQNQKTAKALQQAKTILGSAWNTNYEVLLNRYLNNKPVEDVVANQYFSEISNYLLNNAKDNEALKTAQSINRNLIVRNNAKEALREYFWNSKHATSQIIQLTTTDLAFYKNLEDFQKRYKEVHAPSLRLNTKATFKGKSIGRDIERTIYLKDEEIISSVLEDIKTVLNERVAKNEMSSLDRDLILSQFKKVNVADAQAYRSLSSYRAVLGMSGQWTDAMEQAYNNFKEGTWNIADFNTIWQTKKPYVYTQVNNDSGIANHTGIKTPVQHKNSEFLLLAMHELVAGNLGKSSKLKAINEFMEKYNIDVVQFESTTKVGKQGVIDLSQVNDIKDVTKVLEDTTGVTSTENPNVVHKVSYEDYGIQTATPEHAIDAVQLVGTQIRKLITADIADDAIIEISYKNLTVKKTKKEWLDFYNAINTENIIQSFKEVNEIFSNPKNVEKALQEEIRGNARYGQDMLRACTLDENGNFQIPLFDPVQSQRVQTLLNSIIKSRVTKQKIRGGALIQVSNYGLTDELKIVFEGEGENKHIKYLECYMPAYSREFYEPLMDPETHQLDVTKLPEDLRKLIGYRVPTEDKYSMAPLYIKGFLPQQNGSAIMLPSEITTLSGSDFDVDKMYIMLPEFRVYKYNKSKARQDFAKQSATYLKFISQFSNSELADELLGVEEEAFNEWFKEHKEEYKYERPKVRKVQYDYSKKPQEQSKEARNNALIDLMYGVLTNPDTASKMLNPGGFDAQKKAARINSILQSVTESELEKVLKEMGIKFDKFVTRKGKVVKAPITSYLFDLKLKDLDTLAEKTKVKLDPLNPRTQVKLHQQNMTGAKLIGIYANHNANHALIQHTKLALDETNGAFILNGKKLTSLHSIQNESKEYISRNNAGYLAASVDNVKDPVLAGLNQNTFTADASMLLSRLGYSPMEVGILMAQPIIVEMTNTFFREGRNGKSKDVIIDEIIKKYKNLAGLTQDLTYNNYKDNEFYIEDLADYIILAKEMEGIDPRSSSDFRKVEYYQKQTSVGFLFKRIMTSADALSQVVQATRSDTQGGAAGPTIADTILKMEKVTDLLKAIATNPKFPLIGADIITADLEDMESIDELREQFLNSPLPFLQAFYTLGIGKTHSLLMQYFPHYTNSFMEVIDRLRGYTKTGKLNVKTMNSIYNDLLAYVMTKTVSFSPSYVDMTTGEIVNRKNEFINEFPARFKNVIANNPKIADLEFIKRLKWLRANDSNPVDTIVFKNVGQLSPTLRERYMRDWASLLYMGEEGQRLAVDLFRYSFYRNGFAFGPNTFVHLCPVAVRLAVPEYIDTLNELLKNEDDYSEFIDQYIYNHLDNRKLVPEVPEESSIKFLDENKDPLDEVIVTINPESSSADYKVVKEKTETPEGAMYEFFKFIGKKVKGKYIYYTLSNQNDNEATYTRIEPLGFRNSFIEYEYGKSAEEIQTVISKNKADYDPYAGTNSRFHEYTSADDIDYNSIPQYDDTAYSQDAMNSAFATEFGTPLDTTSNNDITSISPNNSFKDANDEEICGGYPTLYSL